jgi:hypothetical protein
MAARKLQEFCKAEKKKIFASRKIKVQERATTNTSSLRI